MKVIVTGGGTGGHTFPVVALGRALQARGHEMLWLGRTSGMERDVAERELLPYQGLDVRGMPRRPSLQAVQALWLTARASWQARSLMLRGDYDVVMAYGSYVSMPAITAARYCGVPLVVHEGNGIVGLAVRWGLPDASHVFTTGLPTRGLPGSGPPVEVLELPVREEAMPRREPASYEQFGLKGDGQFTVLVFGGSQGAIALCETTLMAARIMDGWEHCQILLATGKHGRDWAAQQDWPDCVKWIESIDDMGAAYGCADVVVSRSGMLTLAELGLGRVPAILVPFPYATEDHQRLNAERWLERYEGTLVVEDELTPERFCNEVRAYYERWRQDALPKLGRDPQWERPVRRTIDVLEALAQARRERNYRVA